MLEIKITGNTPLEALASLTAFGLHCMGNNQVMAAANHILEAEKANADKSAVAGTDAPPSGAVTAAAELSADAGKTVTPLATEAPKGEPAQEPYAEEPPHGDPAPKTKAPTLEEVRAKGLKAARAHGQPAIKTILDGFGVPSMTALAESDRVAFLVKLEGLGEGNA